MYPYCAVAIEMYGGIYLLLIALQLIRHHILAVPTLEVYYIIKSYVNSAILESWNMAIRNCVSHILMFTN